MLRQCLVCWNTAATISGAEAEPGMQDSVDMLVSFVEQSDGPTAAQLVNIAQAILPIKVLNVHSALSRKLDIHSGSGKHHFQSCTGFLEFPCISNLPSSMSVLLAKH